jgi:hypothetical protein
MAPTNGSRAPVKVVHAGHAPCGCAGSTAAEHVPTTLFQQPVTHSVVTLRFREDDLAGFLHVVVMCVPPDNRDMSVFTYCAVLHGCELLRSEQHCCRG